MGPVHRSLVATDWTPWARIDSSIGIEYGPYCIGRPNVAFGLSYVINL